MLLRPQDEYFSHYRRETGPSYRLDERTIRRVVKRLREAGCLTVQTAIKEDAVRGFIKRNSYQIKPVEKDFFLLNNGFFIRNYSAKMAGFLLLLKAICLNNTNTIQ